MEVMVTLIRNGQTDSTGVQRLVGAVDVDLCPQGKMELIQLMGSGIYPEVELVYCSPLMRCRETAMTVYPQVHTLITNALRAYDMGWFALHTHEELVHLSEFRTWVQREKIERCPGGEDPYGFYARSAQGFRSVVTELGSKGVASAAIITHNAVIASILRRFCLPRFLYQDWSVPHGHGHIVIADTISGAVRHISAI